MLVIFAGLALGMGGAEIGASTGATLARSDLPSEITVWRRREDRLIEAILTFSGSSEPLPKRSVVGEMTAASAIASAGLLASALRPIIELEKPSAAESMRPARATGKLRDNQPRGAVSCSSKLSYTLLRDFRSLLCNALEPHTWFALGYKSSIRTLSFSIG